MGYGSGTGRLMDQHISQENVYNHYEKDGTVLDMSSRKSINPSINGAVNDSY